MKKNKFDFIMFDVYLNHYTDESKIDNIDEDVIKYLKELVSIYYNSEFYNNIEKYNAMLEFVGRDNLSKIARDIRQCIENLQRTPYIEECDKSENNLLNDIFYIQRLINKFDFLKR